MPEWIDSTASSELPILRSSGEGQSLEFMREFPSNARELAKEIAAFASTNSGTILIGVNDEGDLVGISEARESFGRDKLLRRIEGLCNGQVQPSITPTVSFAEEAGEIVLVLRVPRGKQPIYYCHNKPYVRHLTEARPARPDEVVDRVAEWLSLQPEEADPLAEFYGGLISGVRELLLWTGELEQRNVNPWLDSLMWMLKEHGGDLRRLAATDSAIDLGLKERLEALSDKADIAGNHRLTLGGESWAKFKQLVADVEESALLLKREVIDVLEVDDRVRDSAIEDLQQASRELETLERRAHQLIEQGRRQELQNEVAILGRNVTRLSYWGLDREPVNLVQRLRKVGRELHVLETLRITSGGLELATLLDGIRNGSRELQDIVEGLSVAGKSGKSNVS